MRKYTLYSPWLLFSPFSPLLFLNSSTVSQSSYMADFFISRTACFSALTCSGELSLTFSWVLYSILEVVLQVYWRLNLGLLQRLCWYFCFLYWVITISDSVCGVPEIPTPLTHYIKPKVKKRKIIFCSFQQIFLIGYWWTHTYSPWITDEF